MKHAINQSINYCLFAYRVYNRLFHKLTVRCVKRCFLAAFCVVGTGTVSSAAVSIVIIIEWSSFSEHEQTLTNTNCSKCIWARMA